MREREKSREELERENAELRLRLAAREVAVPLDDLRRDAQLRLIVDFVRDHAITLLDPEGRVQSFNAPAERIKGYRLDEVAGQHFRIFFTDEDRAAGLPEHELEVARTQGRFEGEGLRRRKDGSLFTAAVSLSALRDERGEVLGFIKVTQDVTGRRQAEEAARAAREQLEVVLRGVGEGITMTDAAGRVVYANEVAVEYLGLGSPAELQALSAGEFATRFPLLDDRGEPLPPERTPAARAMRGERVASELVRLRIVPERAERWCVVTATAIRDGSAVRYVVTIFRDVTESRRAEEALRFLAEASATLASSLDYNATLAALARLCVPTVADWAAVDMLGPDGALHRLAVAHMDPARVQFAQDLATRWPPKPSDPTGPLAVIRTGRPEVFPEITDEMLTALVQDPELLGILRALGLRSSMCVPIEVRGRVLGAITLVAAESGRRFGARDLTLAEEIARRAGVAVDNATSYREAQEAGRLKDEFLATISHELRTPLTAVLGWATMVRARKDDPAYVARGLEVIERNARAQAQLIEDLLDLSRVITGKMRLDARPVDPAQVVDAALDAVRPAAAAKGIALHREVDEHAGPILGDADRLLQVVNNLLTNAVKFTPRGGSVGVTLRRVGSSVTISVRDNGQGITPEFLPHVFERFRQADATSTRAHGGLGLGLAISRSLVELHGGTIAAESEGEGRGAMFTVTLPVAPLRANVSPRPSSAPRTPPPGDPAGGIEPNDALAGVRVLLVDDDADTRLVLASALEYSGAQVSTAASAAEAVAALGAGAPPDVLVSDIGMPGEDGFALIARVRALPAARGGGVPAVALTAYASADSRARALRSGFQHFVPKPVDPAELSRLLAALVGRQPPG